jgi:hypothetical protein
MALPLELLSKKQTLEGGFRIKPLADNQNVHEQVLSSAEKRQSGGNIPM